MWSKRSDFIYIGIRHWANSYYDNKKYNHRREYMLKFSCLCSGCIIWEKILWNFWKSYCQIFRDTQRWTWNYLWYFSRSRSIWCRSHQWFYRGYSCDIDVWLDIRSRRNGLSWRLIWLPGRIYHSKDYWYDSIIVAYISPLCKYITINYTISQISEQPSILWEIFFVFSSVVRQFPMPIKVLANLLYEHVVQYDRALIYLRKLFSLSLRVV